MRHAIATAALLLILAAATPARAQDLAAEVARFAGKNIDLRTQRDLRDKLVERGLIERTAFTVHVDSAFLEKVVGSERFRAHAFETRYHVGDRILVADKGSDGSYNPRAVITEVLPDGKYRVKVWDKVEALTSPGLWHVPHEFTGEPGGGAQPTRYRIRHPDGRVEEASATAPWLIHQNEREVVLTHEEVDRLNGSTRHEGAYKVNGWAIDPATDPVLKERIDRARAIAEEMIPASELVLPEEPEARRAQLEKIAALQVKLVDRLFGENLIDHPINKGVPERMTKYVADNPGMRGKIGAVLAARCGVCFDQAAALTAILNAIADRTGIDSRAINGRTLGEGIGHGFINLRFANGKLGMFDPSWHHQAGAHVVENMDFALFDARRYSNRRIDGINEETTRKVEFVDRRSEKNRELYRGYDRATGEALLALKAKERAAKTGESLDVAATKVIEENKSSKERVAGEFKPAELVARAHAIEAATPGLIGGIRDRADDKLKDRIRDRTSIDRSRPGR